MVTTLTSPGLTSGISAIEPYKKGEDWDSHTATSANAPMILFSPPHCLATAAKTADGMAKNRTFY